ncbi:MAG: aldehyde dehydrogenase family protein, partial [Mucilaginibacter polytrichastri]|nr:aldehyde dehydrogenase family protein [Mucilaginibacter polytrichastri]
MKITSVNPANGKKLKSYTIDTPRQVATRIEQTHKAWLSWRETTFSQRATLLKKAAKVLQKNKQTYAELMTAEMGKPIAQSVAEIEKCAACCEYYAANGASHLADQLIESDAKKSFASFQPIGVVLAIMPWNFPFWQLFRFLAPALMAGNCGVLKHASNVPGCALAIEDVIKEAGFPDHVFQTLLIGSKETDAVIEHPLIRAVTLTGSTPAGRHVAAKAGSLIKKTVLELGGSDAYIVLEDADLELASEMCVNSRTINTGQSCIAAKRFIVVKSVEKKFTDLFVQKMQTKIIGDPMMKNSELGPMARID